MLNNESTVAVCDARNDDISNTADLIITGFTANSRKTGMCILIAAFMNVYKLLSIASWLRSMPQLKKQPIKYMRFAGGSTACLFSPL